MLSVLIVEDNEGMRGVIASMVSDLAVVHEYSDGSEALPAYARYRPDWVLMDVKMPKMNGILATRQIKAAFPEARIVMVSQYGEPELLEAARDAGATGYVLKDDLLAIRRILAAEASPPGGRRVAADKGRLPKNKFPGRRCL